MSSSAALFDLRELRRDVEDRKGLVSFSGRGDFGCRRELSDWPPLLRPPLLRFDDEGAAFSSTGSEGGPADDMAALPLAFLERPIAGAGASWGSALGRLAREARADLGSVFSGCSGLESRAAAFRLREEVGGAEGGGGGCASGFSLLAAAPVDRLADERVTLSRWCSGRLSRRPDAIKAAPWACAQASALRGGGVVCKRRGVLQSGQVGEGEFWSFGSRKRSVLFAECR